MAVVHMLGAVTTSAKIGIPRLLITCVVGWCLLVQLRPNQNAAVQSVEVIRAGVYDIKVEGGVADPGVAGSHTEHIVSWTHRASRRNFPVQLCLSFGFEYRVIGAPTGGVVPLRMVTHFPTPGIRDPAKGNVIERQEFLVMRRLGDSGIRAYTMHEEWEALPGEWKFEVWHQSRRLAVERFLLEPPCRSNCKSDLVDSLKCERRVAHISSDIGP